MNIKITIVLLFLVSNLVAQDFIQDPTASSTSTEKKGFQSSRLFFGGDLGFQFGNTTIIDISPLVGYRFTDRISLGTQIKYNYIHLSIYNISTTIYGASVFSRYNVTKAIFAHVEYEWLSLETKYFNPGIYVKQDRFSLNNILLGGGYRTPIGERSYLNLMILWNINDSPLSPYQNPIIRMNVEI
ncbi:MAG: hypothetical protein Fur0028_01030 [Bacteroidales bacterium]